MMTTKQHASGSTNGVAAKTASGKHETYPGMRGAIERILRDAPEPMTKRDIAAKLQDTFPAVTEATSAITYHLGILSKLERISLNRKHYTWIDTAQPRRTASKTLAPESSNERGESNNNVVIIMQLDRLQTELATLRKLILAGRA